MKKSSLQQRLHKAIKSRQLVRMTGTPAEQMTDFELTRFLMENFSSRVVEHWLAVLDDDQDARLQVSGVPAVRADQFEDIVETLTKLAQQCGGRVRVAGEGLDGAPMDVTIYDGRPRGTRTHQ